MINKDKRVFNVLLEGLELDNTLEPDQKCQVALIDLTEYKNIENSFKKMGKYFFGTSLLRQKYLQITDVTPFIDNKIFITQPFFEKSRYRVTRFS
ncbi:MAG: hypothetical protein ABR980_10805, partial [Ignavibacteriaceae bacterium]